MKRHVLIVNAGSIYSNNATGITLRSVFLRLDDAECLEVSWSGSSNSMQHKIQTIRPHYSKLSIANLLLRYKHGGVNAAIKAKATSSQEVSKQKKILTYFRQYLALIPDRCKLYFSKKEIEEINHFAPSVIYTLGGSVNALRVSYELSKRYNIPIVIHHMDNWLHCIQWEDNSLLTSYKKELRTICYKCYERTTQCIAISDGMAKKFTHETGVKHVAIMNSIDCNEMHCDKATHTGFRFVYAGGMHLERYKALLDFAEAVESNNSQTMGEKAEFAIYTGQDNIEAFGHLFKGLKFTALHPAVPHKEIKKIYENADALIHVESATVLNSDFFKYSISTKIPEYLSTGRPVIFYGPDTLYVYEFLEQNGIAAVVKEKKQLKKTISAFIQHPESITKMTMYAQKYAEEHFSVINASKTLEAVLESTQLPSESLK